MARPTTKRRLRDIDPNDFGRDIADRVKAHVTALLDVNDVDLARIVARHLVDVAEKASLLAQYALDGAIEVERASAALFAVRMWLYSCAAHATNMVIEKPDVFPSEDIGLVLLAAHARVRLSRKQAVPVRELACLAGVDPDHVRLLARQGQMAMISGGVVASKIAKQWLTARGVPLTS